MTLVLPPGDTSAPLTVDVIGDRSPEPDETFSVDLSNAVNATLGDPTGVGTIVEEGKQKLAVGGKDYLVEPALRAEFALLNAFLADYLGNLAYALTARNFNPVMAMAADSTAHHVFGVSRMPAWPERTR